MAGSEAPGSGGSALAETAHRSRLAPNGKASDLEIDADTHEVHACELTPADVGDVTAIVGFHWDQRCETLLAHEDHVAHPYVRN
ncbi:MAG: hypothetical protein PHT60_07695 [Acidiphilium sp.]|nr:hypothetical protein [Acidiphilium sp.]MDD4935646.1 hypothetical protein [Acidiphilium sp.]